MLHDVYTPQRRDVIEKSTEIVLGITGGYAFCHLSILAKTITTRKRGWHARNISAGAEWRFPRKSEMHYVRDVGVAGSNPVTPTIEFVGVFRVTSPLGSRLNRPPGSKWGPVLNGLHMPKSKFGFQHSR